MYIMEKLISRENLPDYFNLKDVKSGGISNRVLLYALNDLIRSKKLIRVKKGVYAKNPNTFYIASRLMNGYIGFSSAFYLHKLKNETEANIYVCSNRNRKLVRVFEKNVININMAKYFYGTVLLTDGDQEMPVSTVSKTIFDMLYKVTYANFHDLFRVISDYRMTEIEWRELLYYIEKSNVTVVRRAGHILSDIAPKYIIRRLKSLSDANNGPSFFFEHRFINYDKEWKIFDSLGVNRWKNGIRSR